MRGSERAVCELNVEPIDVERLKARIREVAGRRAGHDAMRSSGGNGPDASFTGHRRAVLERSCTPAEKFRAAITDSLVQLEHQADLGAKIPEMIRFPRPLRPLARLAARTILVAARFATRQQTDCNHA